MRQRRNGMAALSLSVVFCIVVGIAGVGTPYSLNWPSTWRNPLDSGRLWTTVSSDTAFDFDSSAYWSAWGTRHTGIDLKAGPGALVLAIDDGVVVRVAVSADPMQLVIMVVHSGTRGAFLCVYGHVSACAGIAVGAQVQAGQLLGTVTQAGSPCHLHFGINTRGSAASSLAWGRSGATDPRSLGWVDPIPYLQQTLPW